MKAEFNDAASLGAMLEQMTTEELRSLLDRELHTEPVNEDAIRLIRRILRRRSQNAPVTITPELERAWAKYHKDSDAIWQESRKERRFRSWLIRGAAAAAVLAVLVIPVFPQEVGAESLWETLTRWTAQVVEYFGPTDNEDRIVEYTFRTDHPGLQQVYDTVTEMGITVPVVPMWLPEGYELVECKVKEYASKTKTHARFRYGEFENDGIIYQLFRNLDQTVAVWTQNNVECSIFADCQEEVLQRILKSISDTEDE